MNRSIREVQLAVFIVSAVSLLLELVLIRVFDVILFSNIGYMVITGALFALGLAGVYVTLRPLRMGANLRRYLAWATAGFASSSALLLPILNSLPFDFETINEEPFTQLFWFAILYLTLLTPFFFVGIIFCTVFSHMAKEIRRLYFADLVGAAIGCALIAPCIPALGPGGLILFGAAGSLAASALFRATRGWTLVSAAAALVLVSLPVLRAPDYLDFREHIVKRGVAEARAAGDIETTRWDPVAKIDIIPIAAAERPGRSKRPGYKHVAYDGGTQSSRFYPFDGDYASLRKQIQEDVLVANDHFWFRGVLASHWYKRDSDARVLIIGSAGGQETKAALLYRPAHVDSVEMVGAVVDLASSRYSSYIGNLFLDPRVSVHNDEGRSFLRRQNEPYDIIQIFSNHTSSAMATGAGAMATVYLQTIEAYREYFSHLRPNGVLHINHHIYPRMISTAAAAWAQLGKKDFRKHVVVFERTGVDHLPTMLIKMEPWTEAEIRELERFFGGPSGFKGSFVFAENPLDPDASFLSDEFYSGRLSDELVESVPYHVRAASDDQPYFNFLRKQVRLLEPDPNQFLNKSTAGFLNAQMRGGVIPIDQIHFIGLGIVGTLFTLLFILLPLSFSTAGRVHWKQKYASLIYFSCLGAGFIVLELVLVQIFMRLIGFPLYAYSTVIFTMLIGAGLGSLAAESLEISPMRRWSIPFAGIFVIGLLVWTFHPALTEAFLAAHLALRILAVAVAIFPLGFFLGMPFPLGILAISDAPRGAVGWAWGMNGLFTVLGGVAAAIISIVIGFQATLLIGLLIYAGAMLAFRALRAALSTSTDVASEDQVTEVRARQEVA